MHTSAPSVLVALVWAGSQEAELDERMQGGDRNQQQKRQADSAGRKVEPVLADTRLNKSKGTRPRFDLQLSNDEAIIILLDPFAMRKDVREHLSRIRTCYRNGKTKLQN
ncbi:hypothetical protein OC834_000923 [Tilletia horrida]|nr:hypothetical protein OC834_000923 [Tilletia horrida]